LLRKRGVRSSDRILDYGCGAGLFIQYLRSKGYSNVTGFDRFVPEWSNKKVLELRFDTVLSYDVIEHSEDPRAFLRDVADLVSPGGLLVIGGPNADGLRLDGNLLAPELSQPYHRHILSEKILLELAREEGLQPEHFYRRFYFDTLVPGVNTRFMWSYIQATGGMIDAAVEPPQPAAVLRSPKLLFESVVGYFSPPRGNILVSFRKTADRNAAAPLRRAVAAGA
jgi:SAM-dependent methyltransferase